jgi:predicted tellurium resistance membrane protein TerC
VFYIFGLILLVTAGNLFRPEGEDSHSADNIMIRIARRFLHTSDEYEGDKLFIMRDGQRVMTPMPLVMVAIGGTDILFALDSIPAIFGLTQNLFLVFTATAFSLLGLRQLYFLLDDLLDRLIYLSYGLATILGFIGVKLILHALHENNVPLINDGAPVKVVEISTNFSLSVIVGILIVTVIASLRSAEGKAQTAVMNARRHATAYCDLNYETDAAVRENIYDKMVGEEEEIKKLPERYRAKIREEDKLLALLKEAHNQHASYLSRLGTKQ